MDGKLNNIVVELNDWASQNINKSTPVDDIHVDELKSMPINKELWVPVCLRLFQIMKTTAKSYEILLSVPLCDSLIEGDIPLNLSPSILGETPISFYFALKGDLVFKETTKKLLKIKLKGVSFDTYFLQDEYIENAIKIYERTIMMY